MQTHLLERDYADIHRDLLGKEGFEAEDLALPIDDLAPAQDYIFADLVRPLREMLKRFDILYRE